METYKKLVLGIFGFGVVGEGLYKVLNQTPSLNATIKKVCIKNSYKKRNAPAELFTADKQILLNDPEINESWQVKIDVYRISTEGLKFNRTSSYKE